MKIEDVYIGGWFQRTTLHLTEIFDFFNKKNILNFSKEELDDARDSLDITSFSRLNYLLEYIQAKTRQGIDFKIYEDGLIVLKKEAGENLEKLFDMLEDYYDHSLSPGISLLFSKGAPVPKELAKIKSLLPFILTTKNAEEKEIIDFFKKLRLKIYSTLETKEVKVYKSDKVILIVSDLPEEKIRQLVEAQIFFREFKSQLHRYLNIHRLIWEEIALIKERGKIPGNEVKALRSKLDDYQKTIKLIDSRISQMSSYLRTRAKVSTYEKIDSYLDQVFLYKFETLEDSLFYIKDLWKMTDNYLNSAIQIFAEIQGESTKTSISSLQLVTALGVVTAIIGYLGRDKLPTVTLQGMAFFFILIILTFIINYGVSKYYSRRSYTVKKGEADLA